MTSLRDLVAVSAVRTASGKFGGSLREVPVFHLGAAAIQAALHRAGLTPSLVDDCILGCCRHAGNGTNPARTAARFAGVPSGTPATTITMACASGMRSVILGAQALLCGDASLVVTGGMESMSTMPYILMNSRWAGFRHGDKFLVDGWHDSRDPFLGDRMAGALMEKLAKKYQISREDQDQFAMESHQKAAAARLSGFFQEEIVPVSTSDRGVGDSPQRITNFFFEDETIRTDVSFEKLSQLNAVFQENGILTAGNSSSFADGAAVIVLTTREKAKSLGLRPIFRLVSYASGAVENEEMGIGPSVVLPMALRKAGLTISDLDWLEVNEAFAAMMLANERIVGWDRTRLNRKGGAIALGHPVGCSGARILVTLSHGLRQFQGEIGAAVVGGMGGVACALVIQRES